MKAKLIVCTSVVFLRCLFSGVLHAEDVIKGFALTTLDGKNIDFRSLKGMPIVINYAELASNIEAILK